MSGTRIIGKAFAVGLLMAAASPVSAGDGWHGSSRGFDHHHHVMPTVGYTTPVTRVAGVGTFSRSVWAISREDMGNPPGASFAPKASIIHVDGKMRSGSASPSSACSYEAGVCVIRPAY